MGMQRSFSLSVQLDISQVSAVNKRDSELNTRGGISYLQTTFNYFCLLYKHLTNKKKLPLLTVEKENMLPFIHGTKQRTKQNYHNISLVVIWFFSVVEIPMKHSSLCNKLCLSLNKKNSLH